MCSMKALNLLVVSTLLVYHSSAGIVSREISLLHYPSAMMNRNLGDSLSSSDSFNLLASFSPLILRSLLPDTTFVNEELIKKNKREVILLHLNLYIYIYIK